MCFRGRGAAVGASRSSRLKGHAMLTYLSVLLPSLSPALPTVALCLASLVVLSAAVLVVWVAVGHLASLGAELSTIEE